MCASSSGWSATSPQTSSFRSTASGTGAAAPVPTLTVGASRSSRGRAARVFLDPSPAAESPLARFLSETPIKTLLAIGHIRRRTRGDVLLANTHPFMRELWGRHWVFAHNGTPLGVRRRALGRFNPIGTTDSEHAFCYLLEGAPQLVPGYPRRPSELWEAIAALRGELGQDGHVQLPARRRAPPLRPLRNPALSHHPQGPFGIATLPRRRCPRRLSRPSRPRRIGSRWSTSPLTANETWTTGRPGELWVFDGGELRATPVVARLIDTGAVSTPHARVRAEDRAVGPVFAGGRPLGAFSRGGRSDAFPPWPVPVTGRRCGWRRNGLLLGHPAQEARVQVPRPGDGHGSLKKRRDGPGGEGLRRDAGLSYAPCVPSQLTGNAGGSLLCAAVAARGGNSARGVTRFRSPASAPFRAARAFRRLLGSARFVHAAPLRSRSVPLGAPVPLRAAPLRFARSVPLPAPVPCRFAPVPLRPLLHGSGPCVPLRSVQRCDAPSF